MPLQKLQKNIRMIQVRRIQGGDLGFFGRGVMVKVFEEKIFFNAIGKKLADIVETDFGLHIIKLTDIREPRHSDLADVREQIEKKLKIEMMSSSFGELLKIFTI